MTGSLVDFWMRRSSAKLSLRTMVAFHPGRGLRRCCGDAADETDRQIPDRTQRRWHGRQPGQPVGQGHHLLGQGTPRRTVCVERGVVPRRQNRCQRFTQRDGVLDAQIHALAAGRAVHVRGVPGEQYPAGAVGVGDSVVDPEPRSPFDVGHRHPARPEGAGVEQFLQRGVAALHIANHVKCHVFILAWVTWNLF